MKKNVFIFNTMRSYGAGYIAFNFYAAFLSKIPALGAFVYNNAAGELETGLVLGMIIVPTIALFSSLEDRSELFIYAVLKRFIVGALAAMVSFGALLVFFEVSETLTTRAFAGLINFIGGSIFFMLMVGGFVLGWIGVGIIILPRKTSFQMSVPFIIISVAMGFLLVRYTKILLGNLGLELYGFMHVPLTSMLLVTSIACTFLNKKE